MDVAVARNARNRMNGVTLLASMRDGEAALAFLDPQYRAILDKMNYGNEGQRQKGRASLPQMTDNTIAYLIEEIARVLKPSAHLLLWLDKYSIASGHHLRYLRRAPELKVVDMLCWDKLRIGMGKRFRCKSEFLLVAQKLPTRAKDIWTDHGIPDVWPEGSTREVHPHAKPYVLTERLIRAMTKRKDLVVDPAAGGYGVLEACQRSGRRFIGCDLMTEVE